MCLDKNPVQLHPLKRATLQASPSPAGLFRFPLPPRFTGTTPAKGFGRRLAAASTAEAAMRDDDFEFAYGVVVGVLAVLALLALLAVCWIL